MPRERDLENYFIPIKAIRGRNELTEKEFFGSGKTVWDWPEMDYKYDPEDTHTYYSNQAADVAFKWLDKCCKGKWFWYEGICNNGRSLTIDVWIERDEDKVNFEAAFIPDYFKPRETK